LFKGAQTDGYSLRLGADQIDLLILAAKANWREVEPAIFGTLLERALDPTERHALGAHYTPRAYVERLVLPTVMEPLRAEWANAQAAALLLAHEAAELEAHPPAVSSKKDFAALDRHSAAVRTKWREAREQVKTFHHRLCTLRVLDPACGSANFLYVTLEHLKRLEGEVLNQLDALGDTQDTLDLGRETVTLQQLRGIELNERAAALAELVLWIGYLQWHIRTNGNKAVAEPVVYMMDRYVVGGFYRVHADRGVDENLNAPGSSFVPLAFEQSAHTPQPGEKPGVSLPNRFYMYGVIARLAMLAASYEMEQTDPNAEVYE
jgi:hypothetical protein